GAVGGHTAFGNRRHHCQNARPLSAIIRSRSSHRNSLAAVIKSLSEFYFRAATGIGAAHVRCVCCEGMSCQHDALYRAICAEPDEDTPRLAFADLLEEDGQQDRARFIRTQIALAGVPEYDPLHVSTRQLDPDAFHGWGM